ncbi:phosphatases II [Gymnopus androsaceus JB14]|uniref:Phosphatases II n=1 Tax=Gymnopus androsaceus JB14 TaxID=1447944 RepID=A0A6A4HLZ2_9AGAR|nr:phosphatases II [Gymnopus androsaceus JB14]
MTSPLLSRWAAAVRTNNPGLVSRPASLIVPRLYLSGYDTAMDEKQMLTLGVTHVVSILEWSPELPAFIPPANRLHIALQDTANADVLGHLGETTRFVKAALEENVTNVVLIHCFQGVSRSATVVCAYLISTQDMTAAESITFVQSKRREVSPNNGFRKQLHLYATSLKENPIGEGTAGLIEQAAIEDIGGTESI